MKEISFIKDAIDDNHSTSENVINNNSDDSSSLSSCCCWKEFEFVPTKYGRHRLEMCYYTEYSNPCRIRINKIDKWVSVATGVVVSSNIINNNNDINSNNKLPVWFHNEGIFDLQPPPPSSSSSSSSVDPKIQGNDGQTIIVREPITVGFRPVSSGNQFPNIQAFRFVPLDDDEDEDDEVEADDDNIIYNNMLNSSTSTTTSSRRYRSSSSSRGSQKKRTRKRSVPSPSYIYNNNSRLQQQQQQHDKNMLPLIDTSIRWRKCPTSVTFTFEIGMIPSSSEEGEEEEEELEYHSINLQNKAIRFRFGEAHDAIAIDGVPIGDNFGGERHPVVTFLDKNDVITSATLGLSSYTGEGAFTAMTFEKQKSCCNENDPHHNNSSNKKIIIPYFNNNQQQEHKPKHPLVGAMLLEPTYTYDVRKLGLQLWLTSLSVYQNQLEPITRYGFTLSSDDAHDFNPDEFNIFWSWLCKIKYQMYINYQQQRPQQQQQQQHPQKPSKEEEEEGTEQQQQQKQQQKHQHQQIIDLDSIRSMMEPQRRFLLSSFSCTPTNPQSFEGYLYGTCRHVNITFDVFSINIVRLPDGENFISTLFVDGKQYDTTTSLPRLEEVDLTRNDVLAYAISLALRETDLLFQMGLIRPASKKKKIKRSHHFNDDNKVQSARELYEEIEFLPLKSGTALFAGSYQNTVMARRAVTFLALAGLRMASYETVMEDKDGWDIYDVAAGAALGMYTNKRQWIMELGAICCAMIQIIVPVFLIYRGIEESKSYTWNEISWDVYIARFLFCCYAIFYETKTWEVDNGDRVTGLLCFLPEFSTRKLILGMIVNKLTTISVSVAIVVLVIRSPTVYDVTLNTLALYFIVDLDDELVAGRTLEEHRQYQRHQLFYLKSKYALEYQLPSFRDDELPDLKNLPARYFRKASHRISTATIFILVLGCVWMAIEPWVLGWGTTF